MRRASRLDEAVIRRDPALKSHDVVDSIAHRARNKPECRGQRQTERRKHGLPRFALDVSQRHSKTPRLASCASEFLEHRALNSAGGSGACPRQAGASRLLHGPDDAQKRRGGADAKARPNICQSDET